MEKSFWKMPNVKKNVPLRKHTTFKIGGAAELFLLPENEDELTEFLEKYPQSFILGGGSNLLVSDKGLPVVIALKEIKSFESRKGSEGSTEITVGSGYGFTALSRQARRMGLSGFEFAFGIPGTVGGAVVMNAGASGGEVKDVLSEVKVLKDGELRTLKADKLDLSYRQSRLPEGAVITSATFRLEKGDEVEIGRKMKENLERRRRTQPLDIPSAGSVFRNPPGDYAGRIIEEAGLKGSRVGDAFVSERHANFIVNRGKATASQVLELIEKIEETVLRKKRIRLEREIKLAGDF